MRTMLEFAQRPVATRWGVDVIAFMAIMLLSVPTRAALGGRGSD